jgi:hypothetical protein
MEVLKITVGGGSLGLYVLLRLIEFGGLLAITIYWLRTMQRAIEACASANRTTNASGVWMILIPGFGMVWQFVMIGHVSESLKKEYQSRNWLIEEDQPAYGKGITAAVIISIVFLIRGIFWVQPWLGFLGLLVAGFTMWSHAERVKAFMERPLKEPLFYGKQNPVVQMPQEQVYAYVPTPASNTTTNSEQQDSDYSRWMPK